MAQLWTTTDLIRQIKRRGMIPTSQNTFTDTDFLELATEELQIGILPFLLKVREEFFVEVSDQTMVKDQELYPIPERAIGMALRDVLWSNDQPITLRSNVQSLPRVEVDQIPLQQNIQRSTQDFMFAPRGNNILIVPPPGASKPGTLRLLYHRRPSNLVLVSATAKIVSIDSATAVTVESVPSNITSSTLVDLVQQNQGFWTRGDDLGISTIVNETITFSADLPSELLVGDYIANAGDAPIPQIPLELNPILAQRTVVKVLEALGDQQGVQRAMAHLKEAEHNAMDLVEPRIRGEARKIVAVNYYKNAYRGN